MKNNLIEVKNNLQGINSTVEEAKKKKESKKMRIV